MQGWVVLFVTLLSSELPIDHTSIEVKMHPSPYYYTVGLWRPTRTKWK